MNTPFSLFGKTILVTGASSGIGKSIAIECSRMGAQLILTARNNQRLQETLSLLDGGEHVVFVADLTNDEELTSLVDFLPKLDGVVFNAGISKPIVLSLTDKEDVNDMIETNLLSTINLTRFLVQQKKLKKKSSLVYISSINGNSCSSFGSSLYAASKAAITGFMKGVALELSSKEIRVNSINPGMIETEIFKGSAIGEEELTKDRQKYPLKRYGKPEEVAYAAIFLLSDATQWITGSSLLIDGGYTLQ